MAAATPDSGSTPQGPERSTRSEILTRLQNSLQGKFAIERELGQGGMATVYLARDLRHRRSVAIKVLRPDLANSLGAERFLREIQAASYLLHPHILPLHDSGDADGLLYYVMPYVQDRSLADRIERDGPLPLEDALRIAWEVADALSYAHAQGVVHRDVKPENILLPGGAHACLADFGLAYAIYGAASQRLTTSGITVGSPLYMSPEQIQGQREVNGRTDVYSLGCVLFEMLTGRPPFKGSTIHAVMGAHLIKSIPSLRDFLPGVPKELALTVARALEKDPALRIDACALRDLLSAEGFERSSRKPSGHDRLTPAASAGTSEGSASPPRVLVLPFTELAGEESQSRIGIGLTDEIITSLSNIDGLCVIARSAVLQLQGTTKSMRQLGEQLNVQYIVEGSVHRAGDMLRVSAQLARVADEQLLWAQKFSGRLADLFEIEETIARAIADALKVRLSAREVARLTERPIPDVRAYEYYLRAKQQVFTFTAEALERALNYLQRGTALVGEENAQLIAAKGYVYWQFYNAGISPDPLYLDKAIECGERLFAMDPDSPDGHRLIGLVRVHRHDGDLRKAIYHLKATLAARPDDTDALFWLVLLYGFVGRCSSGYPLMERLLDVDPLTPLHHILPGFLAALDGDLARACPLLLKAHHADPTNPIVDFFYGQVLAMSGQTAEADNVFSRLVRDHPGNFFASLAAVYKKALVNDRDGTLAAITEEVEEGCRADLQYSWSLAQCHALVGESERGLYWLSNAAKLGFVNYPLLAQDDPLLDGIRGATGFQEVVAQIRRQWMAFDR